MFRKLARISAIAITALLGACDNNPQPAPLQKTRPDGSPWVVFNWALTSDPDRLDPQQAYDEQSRRVIEPIYEKTDAAGQAAADKAIGGMPRVEVIDGVKIGFRQLDKSDAASSVSERGFLVLWRRDDRLIGFVYRTRRAIDIERLVAEVPKLIAVVNAAAK